MESNALAVSLTAVNKKFGGLTAVAGIDLHIGRGETVALLGPNGAGKTTTINIMLGLVRPDAGDARLFGVPPHRAIQSGRVGTVLQDAMFLPNATVRDFIELARALYPNASRDRKDWYAQPHGGDRDGAIARMAVVETG